MFATRARKLVLTGTAALGGGFLLYNTINSSKAFAQPSERFPGAKEKFVSVPTRDTQLERLKKESFDVLVVGGGASGSGAALDAVTRGLSVALVEKDDFAAGTSSRSTKLIHGGVRYLEKAVMNLDREALALVFEALHERHTFLNIAPHLTQPLPIMTPCYKYWEVPFYWAGMKLYDVLAGTQKLEWSRYVGASESVRQFPMLAKNGLKGTIVYYDGQMNDSRMNVSIALTAASKGAVVTNHVEVVSLIKNDTNDKVIGARLRDVMTGEEWNVHSKVVVNATGPFSDSIRKMDDPNAIDIIVPSSGVHVTLPDYYSPQDTGLIVPKTKDGRVVFMLPWQGETIAGTTDSSTEITAFPQPHENEVTFILDALSDYLNVQVRRSDVLAAWSGIRPLARDPNAKDTASISRDHVLEVSKTGLVTLAGGKWTTYRRMGQDVIDKAVQVGQLKPTQGCNTKHVKMIGGDNWEPAFFTVLTQEYRRLKTNRNTQTKSLTKIPSDVAKHLSSSYGTRCVRVAELAQEKYGDRLADGYPYLEAEVVYAAQEEYACTAVDVISRRTRLAFLDADTSAKVAPRVVDLMAETLGWDENRKKQELQDTMAYLKTFNAAGNRETTNLKVGVKP